VHDEAGRPARHDDVAGRRRALDEREAHLVAFEERRRHAAPANGLPDQRHV
jgi:hypothetical protein